MKRNKVTLYLLAGILILAALLRFYKLGDVPAGSHQDEISQAYNAYSILKTGADRYGQKFPILFRAFGSYQPPLYTYISTISVLLFGNTIFAIRFLSALSGTVSVFLTYLIIRQLKPKTPANLGLIAAGMLALSPWAIHFSRLTVEASLGLTVFLIGFLLLLKSEKRHSYFPVGVGVLALATHAYYSQRIFVPLVIIAFTIINRKNLLQRKAIVVLGILVFMIVSLPHLPMLQSGSFSKRLDQVSLYDSKEGIIQNISNLSQSTGQRILGYISPKHLFSDSNNQLGRISPGLGTFYTWFFLPFLIGWYLVFKNRNEKLNKLLLILIPLFLLPAVVTGDIFYPLRTLEYLWAITIVIAIGAWWLFEKFKNNKLVPVVIGMFVAYLCLVFYSSYFVIFSKENSTFFGYQYLKLLDTFDDYPNNTFVVDNGRDLATAVRYAYLNEYPPQLFQEMVGPQMTTPYYSSIVNIDEVHKIHNLQVRPISWGADQCLVNGILVGDNVAISESTALEHKLELIFEINSLTGSSETRLFGYKTHPELYSNCTE